MKKYSHLCVDPELYRVVTAAAKKQGIKKVAYIRKTLLADSYFLNMCAELGIDPLEDPPINILCGDCHVTFRTAHGFNIHLGVQSSTCKQDKIPFVKKLIR